MNKLWGDNMKTNMDLKIYVDMDVILETEFSEQEIANMIKGYPFNDFKFNEFNIRKLSDGTEVNVFPHFDIYNNLILTVSYF